MSSMRYTALVIALSTSPLFCQTSSTIPDRPEKLHFLPLVYEPPTAQSHRVALKRGPVVYIVPDRELPLVNIAVYVHTGQYVEPEGKEGLAELTGYLLARGGIKSKSAEDLEERLAFLAARSLHLNLKPFTPAFQLHLRDDEEARKLAQVFLEQREEFGAGV